MKKQVTLVTLTLAAMFVVVGCKKTEDASTPAPAVGTTLPTSLFLSEAPAGVTSIAALKATAKEGESVTIKAVVGGRKNAFVANRAVMTVIDATLDNPCISDDDHCVSPWDYCCTPSEDLLSQMASVQVVGADKRPLAVGLDGIDKLKPLNTLVIQGTVGPRADTNTLVIYAQGIFVVPQEG